MGIAQLHNGKSIVTYHITEIMKPDHECLFYCDNDNVPLLVGAIQMHCTNNM